MSENKYPMKDVDGTLCRVTSCKECGVEVLSPFRRGPASAFCQECKKKIAKEKLAAFLKKTKMMDLPALPEARQ